jgi:hypothetical protein
MAATNQQIYEAVLEMAKTRYPGFQVRVKEESWLMKVLAKILFFNKRFMTGYVTTVGDKIYVPRDRVSDFSLWQVLVHEYTHVYDKNRADFGMLGFGFWYLFPQILGVVALLCWIPALIFWEPAWLWGLLTLLLAAPLPSPGRMKYEMRGYAMSMAVNYWRYGSVLDTTKRWIEEKFTGPDYYFMWPFKKMVRDEIDEWVVRLETGKILEGEDGLPFRDVHGLLSRLGAVKHA